MAGRLGGEEIGLLMPGTGIEAARTACERLRASIAELTHYRTHLFRAAAGGSGGP